MDKKVEMTSKMILDFTSWNTQDALSSLYEERKRSAAWLPLLLLSSSWPVWWELTEDHSLQLQKEEGGKGRRCCRAGGGQVFSRGGRRSVPTEPRDGWMDGWGGGTEYGTSAMTGGEGVVGEWREVLFLCVGMWWRQTDFKSLSAPLSLTAPGDLSNESTLSFFLSGKLSNAFVFPGLNSVWELQPTWHRSKTGQGFGNLQEVCRVVADFNGSRLNPINLQKWCLISLGE